MQYLEKLITLKEERNLTNAEIARLSNIPLATITRIFNGSTPNPTFETIAQIAIALGASIDELAGLKQADAPRLTSPVENTLNTYAELLQEKDARLREKDEMIATLREIGNQDRTQKKRLLWFIGIFMFFIVVVLIIDMFNGHIGYFRY